ncbi:MAG: GMC oxidoreductase [Stellaceae bacterium]
MIEDLLRLGAGPPLEADICIIGAGPAGITIARSFLQKRVRVCLVESGGLDYEDATQQLYRGENVGFPQDGMTVGRLRFLGGTSNHWGGRCTRLDAADFTARAWVPDSGWPIDRSELDPYYLRARDLCGLGPRLSRAAILASIGVDQPELRPGLLREKLWQYAPYPWSFGVVYRDELRRAGNLLLLLHANVTGIAATAEANEIVSVTVSALGGASRIVKAKEFVLCCGAIENARLLLATADGGPSALGNRHDLVGRFYMDHLRVRSGALFTAERLPRIEDTFGYFACKGVKYQIGVALGARAQQQRALLNGCAAFEYEGDPADGTAEAQAIWRALQRGAWPEDMGEKVWLVLRDLDAVAANLERRLVRGRHPLMPLKSAAIVADLEQAPNPGSRVTLANARNALYQREPRLDWQFTELEQRTAEQFTLIIGLEFMRLGLGRCRLAAGIAPGSGRFAPSEAFHPSGTTRMADDPRRGVVDRHCRVFGVANLCVAGSSVFPTIGHANPTLTIVALALRLADQLGQALA